MAQREVGAKTNEIPELAPAIEGLDLAGWVVTMDALQTQREAARLITEVKGGHYLPLDVEGGRLRHHQPPAGPGRPPPPGHIRPPALGNREPREATFSGGGPGRCIMWRRRDTDGFSC